MSPFAVAYLLFGIAPLAALLPTRRLPVAVAWALLTAGCGLIAWVAVGVLVADATQPLVTLALPWIGAFGFTVTPLAALLLLVTVCVFAVTLPYALRHAAGYCLPRRGLFTGLVALMLAAMLALFCAAGVVSFLFTWELAALAIAALVGFETRRKRPVAAGLLTVALSETGSLAGLAGLLVLAGAAGTTDFAGIAAAVPAMPLATVIAACILTFFGFGMKAGIVPLNLWIPDAYEGAAAAITPMIAGTSLNLGLYAFLRIDAPLAHSYPSLGLMILATGAITALTGIMYALMEHDLKRVLAHSSIENIGIATAGFGAGFTFSALGQPVLGGLSMIAGLFHMVNHSTYKTLLFLGAGGMEEAAGTRDLNCMGGLLKRLPMLGTLFVIGAFAIAALPPLNGFASEWMLLQSLLRVVEVASVPVRIVFALAGAALALTAGLAVTCFAMITTGALLGIPRSGEAAAANKTPRTVRVPMLVLALVCFGLSVLATGVIPVLGRIARPLVGADATSAIVPAFYGQVQALSGGVTQALTQLGAQLGRGLLPLRGLVVLHADSANGPVTYAMSTALTFAVLAFMLLVVWLLARVLRRRRRKVTRNIPWNGGIPQLQPEMPYTATTFASPVKVLFDMVFRPNVARDEQWQGAFLTARNQRETRVHVVNRLAIGPVVRAAQGAANHLAILHHGRVNAYAAYILVALVIVTLAAVVSL